MGVGFERGPHPHPHLLLRYKCALAPEGEGATLVRVDFHRRRASISRNSRRLIALLVSAGVCHHQPSRCIDAWPNLKRA